MFFDLLSFWSSVAYFFFLWKNVEAVYFNLLIIPIRQLVSQQKNLDIPTTLKELGLLMLVVIMGMLIFSGLAYVSERNEENTAFRSMPHVSGEIYLIGPPSFPPPPAGNSLDPPPPGAEIFGGQANSERGIRS